MPAQFVAGFSVRTGDRLTLLADYQWVGWSAFDTVELDFSQPVPPDEALVQNYRDTHAIHLGVEFIIGKSRLRGGFFSNQAAAPDETVTPLLPDAPRNHVTAGLGWQLSERFTADFAYQYVHAADRRGRTRNPPAGEPPSVSLNSGVYRSRAHLLGITFSYRR
jgi:long-chain fatty acid transport protein